MWVWMIGGYGAVLVVVTGYAGYVALFVDNQRRSERADRMVTMLRHRRPFGHRRPGPAMTNNGKIIYTLNGVVDEADSRGPAHRVVDRGVFISYRGEDTHSYGALLYTELVRRFGEDRVFLDAESIPAGADFAAELLGRVRSAWVLLAVIGPRWLSATDPAGRRRIDDPADWIRRELAEAFTAGVRVIPVLTDHAHLPAEAELPADIAALSRCQYRHLRHREPTTDLARIVADLTSLDFGPGGRAGRGRRR